MVSFSLRQRISYRSLKDPSPVSFHLIQFVRPATKETLMIFYPEAARNAV